MPRPHADPARQLAALNEQRIAAQQAVQDAQQAVETALLVHQFTGPARDRLAATVQRHREVEATIEAVQQRLDRDQADAADQRAAELWAQIEASISAYLERFPTAVLPEFVKCP